MKNLTKFFLMVRDSKGATMAEYAVIAAVLILIAILAFTSLGTTIRDAVSGLVAQF